MVKTKRAAKNARAARERGMVLIFVLGVLALLAMLVASYALETSSDLRVAQNHQDQERARMVARAGIERAKYELRRCAVTPGYPEPWLVPDLWDYSAAYASGTMPSGYNAYTATTNPLGTPAGGGLTPASSILTTRSPSFGAILQALPSGCILNTPGNPTGLPWPSGFVGSTYYPYDSTALFFGDYYTLKVTDCNSLIDVSDQNPNLAAMINNLATVLNTGVTPPAVPDSNVGAVIMASRPYYRLEEIAAVLTKSFGASGGTDFNALSPYLTTSAYVDNRVIPMGNVSGTQTVPSLATPQLRAPININMAPYPVLVAALSGLVGQTHDGSTWTVTPTLATALATAIVNYRVNPTLGSGNTAGSTSTRRYGFASWSEFATFLSPGHAGGTALGVTAGSPQLAAVVLANANPNTNLNKLVPDAAIYQCMDKTDLTTATTEFCFEPGGTFFIDSLGTILGPDGSSMGQAECTSLVRVWEQYNETNQTDFELNRVDPPGTTGVTGLKDLTTLPESRNAYDAVIPTDANAISQTNLTGATTSGLQGSLWDGQITFNAISSPNIGGQATFAGNIDRTISAKQTGTPTYINPRTGATFAPPTPPLQNYAGSTSSQAARTNNNTSTNQITLGDVLGPAAGPPSLTTPDFVNGSDLSPLAAFVGRGGITSGTGAGTQNRKLMFFQSQTLTTADHNYPSVTLQLGVNLNTNLTTSNVLTTTSYQSDESGGSVSYNFGGDITHDSSTNDASTETTNSAYASTTGVVFAQTSITDSNEYTNSTGVTVNDNATAPTGMTGNSTSSIIGTLQEVVPAFDQYTLDQQTFQFWFKPGQTIPGTGLYWNGSAWAGGTLGQNLVLLDWHSGRPVKKTLTLGSSAVSFTNNETLSQTGTNSTTATTNGASDNATDESSVASDVNSAISGQIYWGAETHLVIYLTVVSNGLQLSAEFNMPQKATNANETVAANMSGGYLRDWTYTTIITPGTWHSVMFPIWVTQESGQDNGAATTSSSPLPSGNKNTAFIVDGNAIPSVSNEQPWPTESDPDARLIQMAYQQMLADYNNMYNAFESDSNNSYNTDKSNDQNAATTFNNLPSSNVAVQSSGGSTTLGPVQVSCDSYMTQTVDWPNITGNDVQQDDFSSNFTASSTAPTAYNAANYPVPVRIPPGTKPASGLITEVGSSIMSGLGLGTAGHDGVCVWVGGVSPNDTIASGDAYVNGSLDFFGLIDNLVIDADLAEPLTPTSTGTQPALQNRFDQYQPSQANGAQATTVYFQKHVPALEWDRPLIVVSQRATYWNPTGGVDLGSVALQFGWLNIPTTTGTNVPNLLTAFASVLPTNSPTSMPANSGWTNPDSGVPWNTTMNANVVESRALGGMTANTATGSGFLTVASAPFAGQYPPEEYFYAAGITPSTITASSGPPMTPIIDDVKVIYMRSDCAVVLQEENLD